MTDRQDYDKEMNALLIDESIQERQGTAVPRKLNSRPLTLKNQEKLNETTY